MLRLSCPVISENAVSRAIKVVRSGMLVQGPNVAELERSLAAYLDVRECVCVSSGTAALHLAVMALDLPSGSEAVVPAFTFPATANACELAGVRTVLADISLSDCCLDPAEFEKAITPRTKLVVPVHEFGQSADMKAIMKIAQNHGLAVVEDAACALGSECCGRKCGTIGTIGCFSFHPRKAITTGEGGAVVTNDPKIAQKLRVLRNHGIDNSTGKMDFTRPGLNYRMTDFQAALALDQLDDFERQIRYRRAIARKYAQALTGVTGLSLPREQKGRRMVYQTYHALVDETVDRNRLITFLKANGIESNYGAQALSRLSFYKSHVVRGLSYSESEAAYACGIALPMGAHVTNADVDTVAAAVGEFMRKGSRHAN